MSYEITKNFPDDRPAATTASGSEAAENLDPIEDVLLVEGVVLGDGTPGSDGPKPPPTSTPTRTSRPKVTESKPAKAKSSKANSGGGGRAGGSAKAGGTVGAGKAGHPAAGPVADAKAPRKNRVTPLAVVVVDPDEAPEVAPSIEESTSSDATGPGETETPSPGRLGRARRLLVGNFTATVLGTVAVALAVALILAMMQLGNQSALNNARSSALFAAKTYSVEIAGYDYRHLDTDFGVVLANSTPSFRSSFAQSSNALKSTLTKYHATATAKVVAAAIISATTSRAEVLVYLDQTVANSAQKGGATTDRSQVEITLVNTGGKWLIDQVTLL